MGNVFVTGVIEAQVRVSYVAKTERGETLDLSASLLVDQINTNVEVLDYAESSSASSSTDFLLERKDGAIVTFAALLLDVDETKQDLASVQDVLNTACGPSSDGTSIVYLKGNSALGEELMELRIEQSFIEDVCGEPQRTWFLRGTNVSGAADSFDVDTTVRNAYGAPLEVISKFFLGLGTGESEEVKLMPVVTPDIDPSEATFEPNVRSLSN